MSVALDGEAAPVESRAPTAVPAMLWGTLALTTPEATAEADAQRAWERLRAWSVAAARAYAPATLAAWRSDWRGFVAYCRAAHAVPFPAQAPTVAAFIEAWADQQYAASAIQRAVSTISVVHRAAELPNPCHTEAVRLALKAMRRVRPARPRQARAFTWSELVQALEAPPLQRKRGPSRMAYSWRELRDRAAAGVAYDTLCRSAEVVALQVKDFTLEGPEGSGTVTIARAKNDPEGEGRVAVLSPDTVQRVQQWLAAASVRDGPAFRRIIGDHSLGGALRPRALAESWRRLGRGGGLPMDFWKRLTAHSTRVGAAQDMCAANIELQRIMQSGGWRDSRQVARYTEQLEAQRGGMAQLTRLQGRWAKR